MGRDAPPGDLGYRAVVGFDWAYRSGTPPWDIGRAQPAFVRLAEREGMAGAALDVGCGTGENALHLAGLGLEVVGIDASPTAIERARRKAQERRLAAEFAVLDALELPRLCRTFDVAIDCGLFHVFSDDERRRFERSLHAVLLPGGRYHLLCFSDRQPGAIGPRRVSQAEIRDTFEPGWSVDSIVAERFDTIDPARGTRHPEAWLASMTRR